METTTDRSAGRKSAGRGRIGLGLAWLVCAAMVIGAAGCRGPGGSGWRMPWDPKPERVPGVTPPYERMRDLRELGRNARSANPAEQERVSGELADDIRDEPDPLIRAQIVRTLAGNPAEKAASVLRNAMDDSSPDVRMAACEAWGQRGGPEAVKLLGQRIGSDTNGDVRLAATRALGQTRDASAVAGLAVALDDQDPALQYRAVLSLREVTGKDFGNDANRWRQYVKGETPERDARPTSIAQRLRQIF
jgi:HEAT repeat protein